MAADHSSQQRIKFTAGLIRRFSCPPDKGQAFLWDAEAPGLGLRATRAGALAFVFQYRLHGKTPRITIGSPDAWTLDQARAEARRLKVLVDQGIDPREEREAKAREHQAKQVEAARQSLTLGDVWERYIEDRRADWGAAHLHDHYKVIQAPGLPCQRKGRLTVAGPLYALKNKRLSALTPGVIESWLKVEKAKRPTVTALAYRLLRAFIHWCEEQEADPSNPDALHLKGLIPENALSRRVRRAVPETEAKGDRLQREDLAVWFEHVRGIEVPAIRAYLQTLLLTGARRSEILGLRWEHVNFARRTLTLRDKANSQGGKQGTRTIPLSPYVASLLRELETLHRQGPSVRFLRNLEKRGEEWMPSPWVFSSLTSRNGRLQEPRIAHNRILQEAGLPHVTLHGLRRTFSVMAEKAGAPAGGIKQIMGHVPGDINELHYKPRTLEELRDILNHIEGWMLEQAGIEQPAVERPLTGLRVVKAGGRN